MSGHENEPAQEALRRSILSAFGSSAPSGIDTFIDRVAYLAKKTRELAGSRSARRNRLLGDLETLKAAEEVLIRHLDGTVPIMTDSAGEIEQANASTEYQEAARRSKAEISDLIASLSERLDSMEARPGRGPQNIQLVHSLAALYAEFNGSPPSRSDKKFQSILIAARRHAGIPSPDSIERSLNNLPAQ